MKKRGSFLLAIAVAAGVHCGDSAPGVVDTADAAPDVSAPPPDGSVLDERCTSAILAEPRVATTYYVAIAEPGADNAGCDGLAPANEGNGRCPFKDLGAIVQRRLLEGTKGVRVELRAGQYFVDHDFGGLRIEGIGLVASESVVLSAYRDERPIVGAPVRTVDSCRPPDGGTIPAGCVRQVLDVAGKFAVVQGLTIQDGLGYDMLVGGEKQLVRCNKLTYTTPNVPLGSGRSDELKLVGADIVVRHNEFTKWESQAIDAAGSRGTLLVEENDFHDPHDRGCGAVGIKFGGHDLTVRRNRIHDMQGATCDSRRGALGGGGTGTDHPDEYSALRIHVVENRVSNVNVRLAAFSSCLDCSFERNDASDVFTGVLVDSGMTGLPECTAGVSGCKPTANLRVVGNRLRNVRGRGTPETANFFVGVEAASEAAGLVVTENVYCASPSAGDAKFLWDGMTLAFDAWKTASGTDATSTVLPLADPRCTF